MVFEIKKNSNKCSDSKLRTMFLTSNKRQRLYRTLQIFFDFAKAFDDVNQNFELKYALTSTVIAIFTVAPAGKLLWYTAACKSSWRVTLPFPTGGKGGVGYGTHRL